MPKTSMNENGYAVFWQNDIWFARQIASMQPISVTKRIQSLPHGQFRIRVARFDPRHIPAAALC
jgi:hypothetical protein